MMSSGKPRTNEYGAEVFAGRIFSWDDFDRIRFDEDHAEAQLITGEHMHLIRAVYEPGATYSHALAPARAVQPDAFRPDAGDSG